MSRVGQVIRCKYCLQKGHKVRSYKFRKDEQHVASTEAVHAPSQVPQNTTANVEDISVDCNDAEAEAETKELVTCTSQIFDKNSVDKAAPVPVSIVFVSLFLNFKVSSTYYRFMLLLFHKRKKDRKSVV